MGISYQKKRQTPKNMLITGQMIFPNQVRSSNAAGFWNLKTLDFENPLSYNNAGKT